MDKEIKAPTSEPMEFWITANGCCQATAHSTKELAIGWSHGNYVLIHAREILEDE